MRKNVSLHTCLHQAILGFLHPAQNRFLGRFQTSWRVPESQYEYSRRLGPRNQHETVFLGDQPLWAPSLGLRRIKSDMFATFTSSYAQTVHAPMPATSVLIPDDDWAKGSHHAVTKWPICVDRERIRHSIFLFFLFRAVISEKRCMSVDGYSAGRLHYLRSLTYLPTERPRVRRLRAQEARDAPK